MTKSVYLRAALLWLVFCLAMLPGHLQAQSSNNIHGTVTDEKGETMPGVNVRLKNTTKGATTNVDGKYVIDVPAGNAVLEFSFIGYQSKEVTVGATKEINVSLIKVTSALDEVIVVGYGSRKKIATTGSISSVKADELTLSPVANVGQGLQGRVAGMQINENSGAPGGNFSVRVRGINSINGSSEPLYIIDGVQISGGGTVTAMSPLSQINPNDIESVEVLKDASAAAIYGARGANGVVLITTKQGKAGNTVVSYEGYYGVQKNTKQIALLNASEYATLENEIYKKLTYPDPASLGEGTNWQNLIFRSAPIQNHQLSVKGGSDKTQFSFSANYFDQQGTIKNTGFDRYAFRLNLDHAVSSKVKMGLRIYSSISTFDGVDTAPTGTDNGNGILNVALAAPPTLQPYKPDGTVFPFGDQMNGLYKDYFNPMGVLAQKRQTIANNTIANAFFEYKILNGLTYKASFNAVLNNGRYDFYSPLSILSQVSLLSGGGSAQKDDSYGQTLLHESILTYVKQLGDHSLTFTGVYGTQKTTNSSNSIVASIFPNDATSDDALQLATNRTVSSARSAGHLDSYLARVNYGFKDKYFVDVTGRVDGSSVFGENHKFGFFPAASVAWRVIGEDFMKEQDLFSDLKLRASWGITGNAAAIGPYGSLALVGSSGSYNIDHNPVTGIAPTGVPNPDLKWEQSSQTNIGLDISFIKNRLGFVFDVYNKTTKNLLYVKQLPLSSGYASITGNFASLSNKGVEMAVNAAILTHKFKWDANANVTINKNKILDLDGITTETNASNYSVLKVGQPLGIFKTYVFDGVYQTGETILPGSGGRTGGVKVKDVNNDGKIDANDQILSGNPNPKFIFGFASSMKYSGFDLNVFLQGVQGNNVFNVSRFILENPLGGRNLSANLVDRWSPTNPSNEYVSGFQGGRNPITNRYLEDGSYIRFKTIALGYTLPKIQGVHSLRAYISGNNLFTITKYKGFDPEANVNGGSNTLLGVDNGVYPIAKSFLIGLQLSL